VSSFSHGLIRIDSTGKQLEDGTGKIMTPYVSSMALDPNDQSVWVGMQWGGGISRMSASGAVTNYSWGMPYDPAATLGDKLGNAPVPNIQAFGAGAARRMAVAFHKFTVKDPATKQSIAYAGAVAVYRGL
jgi:hypothetical protein